MATGQNVLHHDVLLSNYVQHWEPPKDSWWVSDELFPEVTVDKASNDYKRINQSTFQQTANTVVGARSDVATVQAFYDPDGHYQTRPHALDGVIDHLERDEADDVALYEQLQTDLPMEILKNTLELEAFTNLFNTANLGTSYETVPADQMFDAVGLNSNPLLYIRKKCERILDAIGHKANKLVLDWLAWRALIFNPASQAIAPVHTVPAGLQHLTIQMVEEKLQDVLEPGSIKLTRFRRETKRGAQSPANSAKRSVVGPNMILARVEPPSRSSMSALQKFCFVGGRDPKSGGSLVGESANPVAPIGVYTFPMPKMGQRGSTVARVITNVSYDVVKTDSLFVAFGVVDKTNTALYGQTLQ